MRRLFEDHIIRQVKELSGTWRFLTDPENIGRASGYPCGLPKGDVVAVPSQWNNELGLLNYEGCAWYEKKFHTEGGTFRFEFESVMTGADVWLDGTYLGNHYGAFTQFDFIARDLSAGEHTLVVCVDSRINKKSIPQRHTDWFNYGGIARDVWVERLKGISVLENHLHYSWSEDYASATVSASLVLYNASKEDLQTTLRVCVGDTEIYAGEVSVRGIYGYV